MQVTASTAHGRSDLHGVVLGAERRWLVVQVQEGFALSVEVYDERPTHG